MKPDNKQRKCIIIGAGIAGLAVAIRLAKIGLKVQVLEVNNHAGGKLSEKKLNGFRFDSGPSILTKPEYIEELFLLWDKNPADYFKYEMVEPLFRYFFSDGSSIDNFSDRKKMEEELKSKSSESIEKVYSLLDDSKEIFELTHEVFLERSLHQVENYFNWKTIRGLLKFNRIHAFQSMHQYNKQKFKDERLVQLFNRYASYNGSNPFEAPATLNIITHFAVNEGSYLPVGGMQSITSALMKLAEEVGVEIQLNTRVKKISLQNNKVTGVETDKEFIPADFVVSNADINYTHHFLLPENKKPKRILEQTRSSSVIVFYWGINKVFPQLELHNTFFGKNDSAEYDAIFKMGTICDDPSIYVYNSSLKIKTDAPAGMSNWFVMITAPFNNGQNWNELVEKTRQIVYKKISLVIQENIADYIVAEEILTPPLLEKKTSAWKGSVYGNSSNGIFSAFLRHPNFSKQYKGLYFCGGSVHPGAGIPLCLLSAKITSGLIKKKMC